MTTLGPDKAVLSLIYMKSQGCRRGYSAENYHCVGNESLKYETYYKLIIATGIRRGECCGLKWEDIDYQNHTIQ